MKALGLFLLLILDPVLHAQYVFSFEAGRIPPKGENPHWVLPAPMDHWGLDSLHAMEGNYSLTHVYDSEVAGRDFFRIRHDPWQGKDSLILSFRIRHAYPPSSANHWQLAFLSSFSGQPGGEVLMQEGILVGVNLQGKDDLLKIWLIREGELQVICSSACNYQEEVGTELAPAFRVVLAPSRDISLYLESLEGRDPPGMIAQGRVEDFPEGRELALCYAYSAGQDMKLWLDALTMEGDFRPDREAPRLSAWNITNPDQVELYFTENVLIGVAEPVVISPEGSGFFASGKWQLDTLEIRDSLLLLKVDRELPNRERMWLSLTGIGDRDGNIMADTSVVIMRNEAEWGDVVFTELMYDPDPVVGTDLGEYVELYNRSEYTMVLEGWSVRVRDRSFALHPVRMDPGMYALMEGISLPNGGGILALESSKGALIHAAAYDRPLHGPEWKDEGGWSLESPDPELLCGLEDYWAWSEDPSGGTPGAPNSRRERILDRQAPVFLYAGLDPGGRVNLHFSESLSPQVPSSGEVSLFPAGRHPLSIDRGDPLGKVLHLSFQAEADSWQEFHIGLQGVSDCAGNFTGTLDIPCGDPIEVVPGGLLLNELMIDPVEEACEYIECYFPGPGFLDLRNVGLGLSAIHEEAKHMVALSDHSRLVGPGTYLVLTKDLCRFRDFYGVGPSARWVELPNMGKLPDSEGMVSLSDRSGRIIDRVIYREDMHVEASGFNRGISLERISFQRSGLESDNWHSCATVALNGTPGRENSQAAKEGPAGGELELEPEVFSPNNDGYRDLLHVRLSGLEAGTLVHLWITDLGGRKIRVLANSHVGGPSLSYNWDGRDEAGSLQAEGLYVLHLRTWHPGSGRGQGRKKAFAIIHP